MSKTLAHTLALLLAAAAPAASAPPVSSSRPTTHLATTRLSGENNPKRVLTIYAFAMASGDAQRVRDSFWAETPDEKAVVAAYAHLASAVGALRKAATERYGADGFNNIGFGRMFAEQTKTIENTRLFVDGPKAFAFTNRDAKPDLRLVRVETGWKISATSFAHPARHAALIDAQAGAYEELAAEIAAGKYRLTLDAQAAGQDKVRDARLAVMKKLNASATQPSDPSAGPTSGTK